MSDYTTCSQCPGRVIPLGGEEEHAKFHRTQNLVEEARANSARPLPSVPNPEPRTVVITRVPSPSPEPRTVVITRVTSENDEAAAS